MNQQEKILHELLSDPRFSQWVSEGEHENHWLKWMEEHPGNEELLKDAIAIIRGLPVHQAEVSSSEIERSFQDLEKLARGNRRKKKVISLRWIPYAAAAALALLVSVWIWNSSGGVEPPTELTVTTVPGELKDFVLPDSSSVVLNGNSSLKYMDDERTGERIVTLDGEAHFHVRKKEGQHGRKPFVVNTDDIKVTVLGTTFSVSVDSIWTTIVLEEGKVKLNGISDNRKPDKVLMMKPGQKVIYNRVDKSYAIENINAREYNSWTKNQLSLINRSASEVARWMKRNYDIKINIPEGYKTSPLTGSVSLEDPATAVEVVALALGLEAVKAGDKVWDFKVNKN